MLGINDLHKTALGRKNPKPSSVALYSHPALYDANVLFTPSDDKLIIWETEESKALAAEGRAIMLGKLETVKPVDYTSLNMSYFVSQKELSRCPNRPLVFGLRLLYPLTWIAEPLDEPLYHTPHATMKGWFQEDDQHMTGDRSKLINYVDKFIGTVRFGNDEFPTIVGYGDYKLGDTIISRVYYVEGLTHNLFSFGQFCDAGLEVAFRQHSCHIRDNNMVELLQGSRSTSLYSISLNNLLVASPDCLLSKASSTKS
nr:integrase, catalytic region, zinc finger, CCHC-type, peptidase aspartic, catalytic [Tanacetum cinerariifolium]